MSTPHSTEPAHTRSAAHGLAALESSMATPAQGGHRQPSSVLPIPISHGTSLFGVHEAGDEGRRPQRDVYACNGDSAQDTGPPSEVGETRVEDAQTHSMSYFLPVSTFSGGDRCVGGSLPLSQPSAKDAWQRAPQRPSPTPGSDGGSGRSGNVVGPLLLPQHRQYPPLTMPELGTSPAASTLSAPESVVQHVAVKPTKHPHSSPPISSTGSTPRSTSTTHLRPVVFTSKGNSSNVDWGSSHGGSAAADDDCGTERWQPSETECDDTASCSSSSMSSDAGVNSLYYRVLGAQRFAESIRHDHPLHSDLLPTPPPLAASVGRSKERNASALAEMSGVSSPTTTTTTHGLDSRNGFYVFAYDDDYENDTTTSSSSSGRGGCDSENGRESVGACDYAAEGSEAEVAQMGRGVAGRRSPGLTRSSSSAAAEGHFLNPISTFAVAPAAASRCGVDPSPSPSSFAAVLTQQQVPHGAEKQGPSTSPLLLSAPPTAQPTQATSQQEESQCTTPTSLSFISLFTSASPAHAKAGGGGVVPVYSSLKDPNLSVSTSGSQPKHVTFDLSLNENFYQRAAPTGDQDKGKEEAMQHATTVAPATAETTAQVTAQGEVPFPLSTAKGRRRSERLRVVPFSAEALTLAIDAAAARERSGAAAITANTKRSSAAPTMAPSGQPLERFSKLRTRSRVISSVADGGGQPSQAHTVIEVEELPNPSLHGRGLSDIVMATAGQSPAAQLVASENPRILHRGPFSSKRDPLADDNSEEEEEEGKVGDSVPVHNSTGLHGTAVTAPVPIACPKPRVISLAEMLSAPSLPSTRRTQAQQQRTGNMDPSQEVAAGCTTVPTLLPPSSTVTVGNLSAEAVLRTSMTREKHATSTAAAPDTATITSTVPSLEAVATATRTEPVSTALPPPHPQQQQQQQQLSSSTPLVTPRPQPATLNVAAFAATLHNKETSDPLSSDTTPSNTGAPLVIPHSPTATAKDASSLPSSSPAAAVAAVAVMMPLFPLNARGSDRDSHTCGTTATTTAATQHLPPHRNPLLEDPLSALPEEEEEEEEKSCGAARITVALAPPPPPPQPLPTREPCSSVLATTSQPDTASNRSESNKGGCDGVGPFHSRSCNGSHVRVMPVGELLASLRDCSTSTSSGSDRQQSSEQQH